MTASLTTFSANITNCKYTQKYLYNKKNRRQPLLPSNCRRPWGDLLKSFFQTCVDCLEVSFVGTPNYFFLKLGVQVMPPMRVIRRLG